MLVTRAALAVPRSPAQRALREQIPRHMLMDTHTSTSHWIPSRLAGGMKPRCEIRSVPAAELQLAVQMPGELHPLAAVGGWGQIWGLAVMRTNAQVPLMFVLSIPGLL